LQPDFFGFFLHTQRQAVAPQLPMELQSGVAKLTKARRKRYEEALMLWTIFVILLVLWLLGLVTSYTLGGFIHILLVIALASLLIQLMTGRRAV
jgi:hypothetical protein